MVQQILTPVADARLSDPVPLLRTRVAGPGLPPADVQVYWVGFLTAAARICGQGTSFALIITLGGRSQAYVDTLMADLTEPHVRHEFCQSSLLGWQLYIRDQTLCKALLPWGISVGYPRRRSGPARRRPVRPRRAVSARLPRRQLAGAAPGDGATASSCTAPSPSSRRSRR